MYYLKKIFKIHIHFLYHLTIILNKFYHYYISLFLYLLLNHFAINQNIQIHQIIS